MKRMTKYAVSAVASIVLSLTLAGAASAFCTIEVADEYTCYPTGEDEIYCYYTCYCKTGSDACRRALEGDGFEILN